MIGATRSVGVKKESLQCLMPLQGFAADLLQKTIEVAR